MDKDGINFEELIVHHIFKNKLIFAGWFSFNPLYAIENILHKAGFKRIVNSELEVYNIHLGSTGFDSEMNGMVSTSSYEITTRETSISPF